MKFHSMIDVITNSSSSVFIKPPNTELLCSVAKELGFADIKVKVGKCFVPTDRTPWEVVDYLEEKGLPPYNEWQTDALHEHLNQAYLDGSFNVIRETDIDDTSSLILGPEIEVILVDHSGQEHSLSEVIRSIEKCF